MKKLFFLFLFFSLVPLNGCWGLHELNELTIVTGMGIDKGEDHRFLVTLEFLNAPALEEEQGTQISAIIFSLEGDSVAEIVKKMNVLATRKLIFSHMRTLVISHEIAEEGFFNFFEFYESDREIRNDFNIVIVENAKARDVLKVIYPIQKVPTMKLSVQLRTMVEEWGGDPDMRLKQLLSALLSPGREPVLAQIEVFGPVEKGNTLRNIEKVDLDTFVGLEGLAIFKGMKYIGVLPVSDTRNFLLLQDKLERTSITANCGEDLITTARIINSKTKIKARYKNGTPSFHINIELEGRVETTQCADDLSELKTILEYEKNLGESFEKEIMNTIKVMQETYQSDIFGFGEHMERQDYKNYKKVKDNWNEEFAKAEIDLNLKLRLRRTGLTSQPFMIEIEK